MNWLQDIRKSILAAGALLSLALAGGVYVNATAVESGQDMIVRAQGFDPRDFLSGHYVRLSYEFSTPPANAPSCAFRKGAPVFVGVAPQPAKNDTLNPTFACARADIPAGLTIIRGRANDYARLAFGIERFYAPQEDAARIEKALQRFNPDVPSEKQPPVYAVLSIGRDGQARLKALLVGAERINLSWL